VQDRYAGDVGDFFKLALLEHLRAPTDVGDAALSLGIVWYLADDESHNNDGRHITYLDPESPAGRVLRPISPGVYDALADVAAGERSVRRIEESGALTPDTVSFAERLRLGDLASHDRAGRLARRADWLDRAVGSIGDCDLVCLDPDNGIRRDDHSVGPHRNRSEKHSYLSEVAALAGDDRSLVAYHHADRSAPVPDQARRRMDDLADGLGREPLAAVKTSRGSARLFLVVPADRHRTRISNRLTALGEGATASEFTVIGRC
jgi:hypothetical protein